MKKTLFILLLGILLLACAACAAEEPAVSGSFTVTDIDGNELFSATGSVPEGGSAGDLIIALCQADKFAYTYNDGMYDNFNGVASDAEAGWLLYIDGVLAELGANEIALSEGMKVEFRYVSYAEAFPEFYD